MPQNFRAFIELTKFSDFQSEHFDFTACPDSEQRRERPRFGLGIASWPLIAGSRAGV